MCKYLIRGLVATLALIAFTGDARAQESCGNCYAENNQHFAWESAGQSYTEGHGWHESQWRNYTCDVPHGICVYEEEEEEQSPEQLTDLALAAVGAGDASAVMTVLESRFASLVASRGAIQVLACDGATVYGHIPLSPALYAALAEAIPSPD